MTDIERKISSYQQQYFSKSCWRDLKSMEKDLDGNRLLDQRPPLHSDQPSSFIFGSAIQDKFQRLRAILIHFCSLSFPPATSMAGKGPRQTCNISSSSQNRQLYSPLSNHHNSPMPQNQCHSAQDEPESKSKSRIRNPLTGTPGPWQDLQSIR